MDHVLASSFGNCIALMRGIQSSSLLEYQVNQNNGNSYSRSHHVSCKNKDCVENSSLKMNPYNSASSNYFSVNYTSKPPAEAPTKPSRSTPSSPNSLQYYNFSQQHSSNYDSHVASLHNNGYHSINNGSVDLSASSDSYRGYSPLSIKTKHRSGAGCCCNSTCLNNSGCSSTWSSSCSYTAKNMPIDTGRGYAAEINNSCTLPASVLNCSTKEGKMDPWIHSTAGLSKSSCKSNSGNYCQNRISLILNSDVGPVDNILKGSYKMETSSDTTTKEEKYCIRKQSTALAASGDSESKGSVVARWSGTLSTRSTQRSTEDNENLFYYDSTSSYTDLYKGPEPTPPPLFRRLYDPAGPLMLKHSPLNGIQHSRAEMRVWHNEAEKVISQNSSKRKVHRAYWLSPLDPTTSFPVAVKFVEDGNARDGRSIKREIECHLYIYQRLWHLSENDNCKKMEDFWPCSEMFGYYLDKKQPGKSVLVTRKLSGPDFFEVIRTEHTSMFNVRNVPMYEFHKLQWCALAMERISQYSKLAIRHNDIKPDNIVLDFYASKDSKERQLDVKLIDLGTASMQNSKDFTGGTSWYESPEQKVLEFYTKKEKNPEAAKQVDIGLKSDAWGAGLSISEVLMGRRVVDSMKAPHGPGALEYRGFMDGWVIEPDEWSQKARTALGLDKENQRFPLCSEAARHIFDALVLPHPENRQPISKVIPKLHRIMETASLAIQRKMSTNSHPRNRESNSHIHNSFSFLH